MTSETSSCINLEPHNYVPVEKKWQTIDYAQYQRLEFSEQVLVCSKCGSIVNPWAKEGNG